MSKHVLVIDGHPDPDRARLCHALAETYCNAARGADADTRLITVAQAKFALLRTAADFARPPEDSAIVEARADLLWADHIVLVFPLWLGGAPALLHGFLEQAARANFAAETEGPGIKQKLTGKSARIIVTMGMPATIYRLMFHEHGVRRIMQGVLGFGGIKPIRRTLFGGVEAAGERQRQAWFAQVEDLARRGL